MYKYYLLKSHDDYYDFLVRKSQSDWSERYFNHDSLQWEPIGIMNRYFWPDSPEEDLYMELTEEEANKLVKSIKKENQTAY